MTLYYVKNAGSYSLVNKTLAPPYMASFATFPFVRNGEGNDGTYYTTGYADKIDSSYPIVSRLSSDIVYSKTTNPADFNREISYNIARLTLAYSAGYFQSSPATVVTKTGVVTEYPLVSLCINVFLIYAYALLAFFIFVWVSLARIAKPHELDSGEVKSIGQSTQYAAHNFAYNAQLRLTQPSTLVAALFPSRQGGQGSVGVDGLVHRDSHELFGDEAESAIRLRVGLNEEGRTPIQENIAYGVWKSDPERQY